MSLDGVSLEIEGTSQISLYHPCLIFGRKPLDESPAAIFYQMPSFDEIKNLISEGPFNLQIFDNRGKPCYIPCFVEKLKEATKGIYYGPFGIYASKTDTSHKAMVLECYFIEELCPKLKEWGGIHPLYSFNNNGIWTMIYKYIVDPAACGSCDLELAPTKIGRKDESSFTSNSDSRGLSLLHYDPKLHGSILYTMDLPSEEFILYYLKPLEEQINKCSRGRAFPLQFFTSDGSFEIIPCFPRNNRNDQNEHNSSLFDIEIINEIDDVVPGRASPLQFLTFDENSTLISRFDKINEDDQNESNSGLFEIEVINDNGDSSPIECYMPNVPAFVKRQIDKDQYREDKGKKTGSSVWSTQGFRMPQNQIGSCKFTITYKNGIEKDLFFKYRKPNFDDISKYRNPYCMDILFEGQIFRKAQCYYGNIDNFRPNRYTGPYLIQAIKNDGSGAWLDCYFEKYSTFQQEDESAWLDCYFKKDSALKQEKDMIHHRLQELYLERDEFESQKNAFLGFYEPRSDTEVKCFEKNGVELVRVLRTIKKHDMTRDDSNETEF